MKSWCVLVLLGFVASAASEPFDAWAFHVKQHTQKDLQHAQWINDSIHPTYLSSTFPSSFYATLSSTSVPADEVYWFEFHYRQVWHKDITLKPQVVFVDYQDPSITPAESVTFLLSTEISF